MDGWKNRTVNALYGARGNSLFDQPMKLGGGLFDMTTADVLNTPIARGSVLPLTEYVNRAEFDTDSGLFGAVKRAFTAPGRAYSGQIPESQMIDEGMNFAGNLALGGYMAPRAAAARAVPASRHTPEVITAEVVGPSERFGVTPTSARNWVPFENAYANPNESPKWPSSWEGRVSPEEMAAFTRESYYEDVWRDLMNKKMYPDGYRRDDIERWQAERELMDEYPGLGEEMRKAQYEFKAVKNRTAGKDPWANDPYSWFNRPQDLGQPDMDQDEIMMNLLRSMKADPMNNPATNPAVATEMRNRAAKRMIGGS